MELNEALVANVELSLCTIAGEEIGSTFAMRFKNNVEEELRHDNETSPQTYVADLLEDILLCLLTMATVTKEATVFSLRPDLVVVLYMGRLVLAVEIKNPGAEVFSSEVAVGQVYDYLKGLTSYGHQSPLIVLSTYNQMVLAWLKGTEEEVFGLFGQAAQMEVSAFRSPKVEGKKQAVSPDRSNLSVTHAINLLQIQDDAESDDAEDDDEIYHDEVGSDDEMVFNYRGRGVYYTQVFDYKKAPRVLALGLKSRLLAVQNCTWKGLMVPGHGERIKREVCFHHKGGFTWGNKC